MAIRFTQPHVVSPRARSRQNPLVSWTNEYKGKPSSAEYFYAPELIPSAQDTFTKAVATSDRVFEQRGLFPLPLSLFLVQQPVRSGMNLEEYRKVVDKIFEDVRNIATKTKSVCLIEAVDAKGESGAVAQKPGLVVRVTPHTPFNLFHRLAEELTAGDSDKMLLPSTQWIGDLNKIDFMCREINYNFDHAVWMISQVAYAIADLDGLPDSGQIQAAIYSSGLNTKAGRLCAINSAYQGFAEGFAKFCLSKDPLYDPDQPLAYNGNVIDTGRLAPVVDAARRIWRDVLHRAVWSVAASFSLFVKGYYSGGFVPWTQNMAEQFIQNIHHVSYSGPESTDFVFNRSRSSMPYDLIQHEYGITFGYPTGASQAAIEVNFVNALLKSLREKEAQQKTKGMPGLFVGFGI
jgi:hypothetical protein